MKKCASCTKDLPDAALHCVFCGAKQAPSAAPAPAKTVMGYQAGDMIEQLRAQSAAAQAQPKAPPQNLPAAAPYSAPPRPSAPSQPPPSGGPQQAAPSPGGYQLPAQPPGAGVANAATMFDPNGAAQAKTLVPQRPSGPSQPPPVAGAYQVPIAPAPPPAPMLPAPVVPVRPAPVTPTPPYLASQTAARAGRPVEPWRDSLRLIMFVWGVLLLAAFATPVSIDPLVFNWDAVIHARSAVEALGPLVFAAVGLLSVVVAAIPMSSTPRGVLALVLGLAGVFVPMCLGGMPPWQPLVSTIGMAVLIPSLFVRNEYRDSVLPRILITLGALAALLPILLPTHGVLPLVEFFKAAIDVPGAAKIVLILMLAQTVLIVISLLAWLPAPSSAGAKVLGWLLVLWPFVVHAAALFLIGDPSNVTTTPYAGAMSWVAGGAAGVGGGQAEGASMLSMLMAGATMGVAYLAILGYGGATVIGKNLE